jgi:hypothetical protein
MPVERWASGQIRRRPAHQLIDDSELVKLRMKARETSLANAYSRLMAETPSKREFTVLNTRE